jgi:myosin heavy subunit
VRIFLKIMSATSRNPFPCLLSSVHTYERVASPVISRQFIKIQFSKAGRIVGATIEKYLLEKTRIVHQMDGERNFHIFYQLLRGANADLKTSMELSECASDYQYLSDAESVIPSISDADEFQITCDCMESIGIDKSTRKEIFTAISGILHLGNLGFDSDPADHEVGKVSAAKEKSLQSAARLLGLQPEELLTAITKQNMHVGGAIIVKPQTHLQAIEKRDSLSRCIYSMLFSWLVDKINSSISAKDDSSWGYIGVLDIYGFENFHSNGFEQLLINYANEKLQNHFNKHIFQIEQAEYESESIDWSYVTFYDNQQCVDLVDGKPNGKSGVFQTLDDASASGRLDVNSSFLAQLNQTWSGSAGSLTTKHPNYVAPRFNSDSIFGVLHYAGEVQYNIASFAEKNRDSTNNDMRDLLAKSSNKLLRDVMESVPYCDGTASGRASFIERGESSTNLIGNKKNKKAPTPGANGGARSSKLKEDSISKQFSSSLRLLCETLDVTDPHFVRCMKPNSCKLPNALNALELRSQVRITKPCEWLQRVCTSLGSHCGASSTNHPRLSPK